LERGEPVSVPRDPIRPDEFILLPVNVGGNHWALFVIDMHNHQVVYYDSFLRDPLWPAEWSQVSQWCVAVIAGFGDDSWTKAVAQDMPQQTDEVSCGVFTMAAIDAIVRNVPICISPSNVY
jgi:sentrin-specific protease 1